MDSTKANVKHLHHEINWKLFARRMQKNPFMREYKISKIDRCAKCGKRLKKFQLHHVDYDHYCQFNEPIKLPDPTEKRPNRYVLVPDCESCKNSSPDVFEGCARRVVPVHGYCNKILNDKMEKYIKNDDGSEQLSLFED
jgi:hypothetical protein